MDKMKEKKIDYLKLWLTFFVTIDVGLIAWFFNNFDKNDLLKASFCLVPIIIISTAVPFIHFKIYKLIKSIGA